MKRLQVVSMGEKSQGVHLRGDKRNPEPEHFRVVLPFGDVDIVRCDDGSYWVHFYVNDPRHPGHNPDLRIGKIVDARMDSLPQGVKTLDTREAYRLAVRLAPHEDQQRRDRHRSYDNIPE